ncbi:MAG: fatty acid cis/trans isomerase [Bdellovibrionales bacterium]|nr:fatty acid cis/trans isomerase [Bdellovibrionales bacterium]
MKIPFRISSILVVLLALGCSIVVKHRLDEQFGAASPRPRITEGPRELSFYQDVKPVLDNRCVVCHACYDSPCQLKLSSIEGIDRGANKQDIYDGTRLGSMEPTRLYVDALDTAAWRKRDFYPVLNERAQEPEAHRVGSLLSRMLELKARHPLPERRLLDPTFDLALDRKQQCPTIEEFDQFSKDFPLWGMPYALPQLSEAEQQILLRWVEQGATAEPLPPLGEAQEQAVHRWEAFLNQPSLKAKLVSRYLYEHLFLGHLYFEGLSGGEYFRLVRSKTPPGELIVPVATRRPFEDPGTDTLYYRLAREHSTITAKTHLPYALSEARMKRWQELFFEPTYEVNSLPSYALSEAANPFQAYQAIPVRSRYRFLLDDAAFFIGGFIKGPVCRGHTALNVIEDRFWVFFANPESPVLARIDEYLSQQSKNLILPAAESSDELMVTTWLTYARMQQRHLQAKTEYLAPYFKQPEAINLGLIWDGDGKNADAALTIFRHYDSASVVRGMVGEPPKTAWIISYTLLERIHYLLVAGFDVYGTIGHQFNTRVYMDFLRMEGEFNFLSLLPVEARVRERDYWYRDAVDSVRNYITWPHEQLSCAIAIPYTTDEPKQELYAFIRDRLHAVLDHGIEIGSDSVGQELSVLTKVPGDAARFMPELSFVRIGDESSKELFSIMRDTGLKNVASIFFEKSRRVPQEDRLSVAKGALGSYPNAFFSVPRAELAAFRDAVSTLSSASAYEALMDRWGVRRTDPAFWQFADWLHQVQRTAQPQEPGLFDFNRLENR